MTYILVKTVTTVVTTTVLDSTICVYTSVVPVNMLAVARLYSAMLLLEMIPGATRPSTDINSNNINCLVFEKIAFFALWRQTDRQTNRQTNRWTAPKH